MIARSQRRENMLPAFSLVVLTFAFLAGCPKTEDKKSRLRQANEEVIALSEKLSSMNSASMYLFPADLDKFRPGRAKDDVLLDVKWRGYFYMAAEHHGKAVCAIVYDLHSGAQNDAAQISVWAMFQDEKFAKFVKPPKKLPGDDEVVVARDGSRMVRSKRLNLGDGRFLIRALDCPAVTSAELQKELKSFTSHLERQPDRHIDPGLTAAFLILRAIGAVPGRDVPPASAKEYLQNAQLRDQFNAARLRIGMREQEVEAVLKAKPLESGKVEAGDYRIYGSNEWFNFSDDYGSLHFVNIVVVFRAAEAIAISSVPAGYNWREDLRKLTADLP